MTQTIEAKDLYRSHIIVPADGGEAIHANADGEPQWTMGLDPGMHEGRKFRAMVQDGTLEVSRGCTVIVRDGRRAMPTMAGAAAVKSGANPDFKPTTATAQEARLRRIITKAETTTKEMRKAQRRLERQNEKQREKDAEAEAAAKAEAEAQAKADAEAAAKAEAEAAAAAAAANAASQ